MGYISVSATVCWIISWLMWSRGQSEAGFDNLQGKKKWEHSFPSKPNQPWLEWTKMRLIYGHVAVFALLLPVCASLASPEIWGDLEQMSERRAGFLSLWCLTGGENSRPWEVLKKISLLVYMLPHSKTSWGTPRPSVQLFWEEIKCFKAFPPLLIFNASTRLRLAHWRKKSLLIETAKNKSDPLTVAHLTSSTTTSRGQVVQLLPNILTLDNVLGKWPHWKSEHV